VSLQNKGCFESVTHGGISVCRFMLGLLCCGITGPLVSGEIPKLELLEAVRTALSHHPQLVSQQAQIEISRGAKAVASSIFDPVLQSGVTQNLTNVAIPLAALGAVGGTADYGLAKLPYNDLDYSVTGTKLYRSGISVSPSFQVDRTTNISLYPNGLNNSIIGLTVNIPLLRGRGSNVVAARERAAAMEVRAAQYDLEFLLGNLASTVAQDYWGLVAAHRNLQVAVLAEARGKRYVDNTQALIDAGHVPRSDINQVEANLAQRTSTRITAENSLVVARQLLSQDIGLSAEEIIHPLGEPADDFPAVPASTAVLSYSQNSLQEYLSRALTQRADYLAALSRKEEASTLLPAAKNGLLPSLNASFGGGYQDLRGGRGLSDFLASPVAGIRGPNVAAALTYSYPLGNQAAHGALLQTEAAIRQSDIAVQEVARAISRSITVAVDSVRSGILRVDKARLSVALSQEALTGAWEKYRVGLGSLVEILQDEDLLDAALGEQVQARLTYALALTQYRFALGTLVPANQQIPVIQREAFMELGSVGVQKP